MCFAPTRFRSDRIVAQQRTRSAPSPRSYGERVGVRGGTPLDGFAPHPHPLPAPRAGRGSDRVCGTVVHQYHRNALVALRFRGSNHIDASINLVAEERARHPEARVPHLGRAPRRIARVSKDGHKRDRASGHPSRRRFAPPQTVCPFLRGATHPRCGMRGLPG